MSGVPDEGFLPLSHLISGHVVESLNRQHFMGSAFESNHRRFIREINLMILAWGDELSVCHWCEVVKTILWVDPSFISKAGQVEMVRNRATTKPHVIITDIFNARGFLKLLLPPDHAIFHRNSNLGPISIVAVYYMLKLD